MIYFDSAATTFQKPPSVSAAMQTALAAMSSPGRGGYESAMRAAELAFDCRSELAELFGMENPEQVVFTMNATHALNIAIKSLVPRGGRAVISAWEHNAVTRPLAALGAEVSVAGGMVFDREAALDAFERQVKPGVDAVVCTHVSNVFGFVLPVEEIASLCRGQGVPLIIDASQSSGILPLDMKRISPAFAAMPGHKGMYGPQGTGVLLCGEAKTEPLLEGGTGSLSVQQEMPEFLPDRLEAGTHNIPGIAGLLEGVRFVRQLGTDKICHHERLLAQMAAEGLRGLPGVRVFAQPDLANQTGVLSFTVEGKDVEEVARRLGERHIAVRAGIHCAPLAHRSAGTLDSGTVRLSFSVWNTAEEIRQLLRAMEEIVY